MFCKEMVMNAEYKDRIGATLDLTEILDLLQLDAVELLDILDEAGYLDEEAEQKLLRACD